MDASLATLTRPEVYLVAANNAGGNVGTLVRACAAFGAAELVLVGHPKHATHGAHGAQKHVKVRA
jgi:tRNA C32,U32 (ribose-2'-O)-methylase TrmJ